MFKPVFGRFLSFIIVGFTSINFKFFIAIFKLLTNLSISSCLKIVYLKH